MTWISRRRFFSWMALPMLVGLSTRLTGLWGWRAEARTGRSEPGYPAYHVLDQGLREQVETLLRQHQEDVHYVLTTVRNVKEDLT